MREIIGLENLVEPLCQCAEISDTKAFLTLQKFFSVLDRGLVEEKYVRIKGLGIFKLIDVDNRKSVSIQTGKEIEIESHKKVSFTVDSCMKEFLNKPYSHYEVVELSEKSTLDKKVKVETEDKFYENKKEEQVTSFVTKRETSYKQIDKELEKKNNINRRVMWIILFLLSLLLVFGFMFLMTPEILERLFY